MDALFTLASPETNTEYTFKKTKIDERDLLWTRTIVRGQEITLKTLIEKEWRIYDPLDRRLIDEFTSNESIFASSNGISPIEALRVKRPKRKFNGTK